jgi:hypothetical protein
MSTDLLVNLRAWHKIEDAQRWQITNANTSSSGAESHRTRASEKRVVQGAGGSSDSVPRPQRPGCERVDVFGGTAQRVAYSAPTPHCQSPEREHMLGPSAGVSRTGARATLLPARNSKMGANMEKLAKVGVVRLCACAKPLGDEADL